mmetsp:Transcript_9594/g.32722  ORF Transcript_9594/g.32722 Transcript_9594/m.32722 type:complete len:223 (+) Transcript_9594:1973-2641(+)
MLRHVRVQHEGLEEAGERAPRGYVRLPLSRPNVPEEVDEPQRGLHHVEGCGAQGLRERLEHALDHLQACVGVQGHELPENIPQLPAQLFLLVLVVIVHVKTEVLGVGQALHHALHERPQERQSVERWRRPPPLLLLHHAEKVLGLVEGLSDREARARARPAVSQQPEDHAHNGRQQRRRRCLALAPTGVHAQELLERRRCSRCGSLGSVGWQGPASKRGKKP